MVNKGKKANIALIGAGHWGKNLARNFHSLGVLNTVCDIDSERLKKMEESYEGIYELGEGTQIEKRVERVHYENAKLLSERGISGWWSAQG